ncbi:MAG TPA: hypothetical protein QGH10_23425, partial [Armatimonadota bacterium]|nr:hypothetical protein [Armatimonadota bacterium]
CRLFGQAERAFADGDSLRLGDENEGCLFHEGACRLRPDATARQAGACRARTPAMIVARASWR